MEEKTHAAAPAPDEKALPQAATVYGQVDQQALAQAEAQVAAEWQVGDTLLDLYEVTGLLGEGGMGKVYKVHHKGWNTDLAVKSPRPEIFSTTGGKENFIREAETWVNLGLHPHTVSCYYVRTLGDIPRVFAEYVEGGSLEDWIRTRKLYEGRAEKALERILDIAIQFAWGLDYAHEQGLIHQDVKPANVMITADGVAKVTDFGLAKARGMAGEAAAALPGASILVSAGGMTPAYCSPEQARGEPLSRKTDIWSWGLSVLEMFTVEVTWLAGQAAAETLESYLETDAGQEEIPRIPAPLVDLLKRCFALEPEARPANMAEIGGSLKEVYGGFGGRAYRRRAPKPAELTADSLNNRALSFLDLGKQKEADENWKAALTADPQHPEATCNHGVVQWRRGEISYEALVQSLEEVRASQGDTWNTKYMLALAHLERGETDRALPLLEEAAAQAPEEADLKSVLELVRSGAVSNDQCARTLKLVTEGDDPEFYSVFFRADGRFALEGDFGEARLWEIESGRCVGRLRTPNKTADAGFLSADGRYAVSLSQLSEDEPDISVWEIATEKRLKKLEVPHVSCVWLTADARYVLAGGGGGELGLWEVSSGHCLRRFEGHTTNVESLSLSRDESWALTGGLDGTVRLWEVATGRCLRTFEQRVRSVKSVCLSPDGRLALSGGGDYSNLSRFQGVRLWDVASGRCLRVFEGHTEDVESVWLSQDARWAVSGDDEEVRLWEVSTGRCLRVYKGHSARIKAVCLQPESGLVLSASDDSTLRVWNLPRDHVWPLRLSRLWSQPELAQASEKVRKLLNSSAQAVRQGRFPEALASIREARGVPGYERAPQSMEAWSGLYQRCRRVGLLNAWLSKTLAGHTDDISSLALTRDGRLAASDGEAIRLWELDTGRSLVELEGHEDLVESLCLSWDDRYLLSGSEDQTLRLWELGKRRCVRVFKGHTSGVLSVALSPDGYWALSGSTDRTLRLWDARAGRCLRVFEGHESVVSSVCWSADARLALSGSWDNSLRLWEVPTGRCLRTFAGSREGHKGHRGSVTSVCLNHDGSRAISGGHDKTVRVWHVNSGNCLQTLRGHQGKVPCLGLSSDDRWVLSAGVEDKTARLWDAASGSCVRTLEGHTGAVYAVCLSADGRWAVSGGEDKLIRIWELDWDLEAPAAASLGRTRPALLTNLSDASYTLRRWVAQR